MDVLVVVVSVVVTCVIGGKRGVVFEVSHGCLDLCKTHLMYPLPCAAPLGWHKQF